MEKNERYEKTMKTMIEIALLSVVYLHRFITKALNLSTKSMSDWARSTKTDRIGLIPAQVVSTAWRPLL